MACGGATAPRGGWLQAEAVPSVCAEEPGRTPTFLHFLRHRVAGSLGSSGQNRWGWESRLDPFSALGHFWRCRPCRSHVAGLPGTAPIAHAGSSLLRVGTAGRLPLLGTQVFPAPGCPLPARLLSGAPCPPRVAPSSPGTSASPRRAGCFDLGHRVCSEQLWAHGLSLLGNRAGRAQGRVPGEEADASDTQCCGRSLSAICPASPVRRLQ